MHSPAVDRDARRPAIISRRLRRRRGDRRPGRAIRAEVVMSLREPGAYACLVRESVGTRRAVLVARAASPSWAINSVLNVLLIASPPSGTLGLELRTLRPRPRPVGAFFSGPLVGIV